MEPRSRGSRRYRPKYRKKGTWNPRPPQHPRVQKENNENYQEDFKSYWDQNDISIQGNELGQKLINRELECTICLNIIGWKGQIWTCETCRIPCHLSCTKKWKEKSGANWNCPNCNIPHDQNPTYHCFCGKVEEPLFRPMNFPHTCGDICGRKRGNNCPHLCPVLCHPGACPPCTAMAPPKTCPCGKQVYQVQCKDREIVETCGEICEKELDCKEHQCEEECHPGDCPPCENIVQVLCYCNQNILDVKCGIEESSCEEICGRRLNCGNHYCNQKCHPGDCQECQYLPELIKTCPCGKTPVAYRQSCMDPIKTCGKLCKRVLRCGHLCPTKCHHGECPPCEIPMTVNCRCGASSKTIKCYEKSEEFLCGRVCNTKKTCNRHKCLEMCCPVKGVREHNFHMCTEFCGKLLNCGIHECIEHCHMGNCEKCKFVYRSRIYCGCGKSFREPPILCGTKETEVPCSHKCKKLLPCGHKCRSTCHKDECPPCFKLVEKQCFCGAAFKLVECKVETVQCGKVCGKERPCGHVCKYNCHKEPCEKLKCESVCGKKTKNCEHGCRLKCHPGPCPKTACKVEVQVFCPCKAQSTRMKCHKIKEKLCDDECIRIQRNQKLKAALKSSDEEEYTEELVEFAKKNKVFVKKLEERLEWIIDRKENLHMLPKMNAEQRFFCHEFITRHYGLDTESVDQEPARSVVVYMTNRIKLPNPPLSVYLDLLSKELVKAPAEKEIMATLLFYELTASESTSTITEMFRNWDGQYLIKWINDFSCELQFFQLTAALEAKKFAERRPGPFSVCAFKNHYKAPEQEGYVKRFKNSRRKGQEVDSFESPQEIIHSILHEEIEKIISGFN